MIGQLNGKIVHKDLGFLILDVSGVGYKISVTNDTLSKAREEETLMLWTYLAVRENSLDLYGFSTQEERNFFNLLLGVSGIGPKSALAILDIASVNNLKAAVQADDISYLTKVSGIGKKSAEKIIIELRDKLGAVDSEAGHAIAGDSDAMEALTSLGYSTKVAREALKQIPSDISDTGERVKEALKNLGK